MRLTSTEVAQIKRVVLSHDARATCYLFGSRTNDLLKGGDIDLLLISDSLTFRDRISILSELKITIGDQKIDLLIRKSSDATSDPFVAKILKTAILL